MDQGDYSLPDVRQTANIKSSPEGRKVNSVFLKSF